MSRNRAGRQPLARSLENPRALLVFRGAPAPGERAIRV